MSAAAFAALATDLLLGEPPGAVHPTVAMGRWIGTARRMRRARGPLASLAEGALW
ncbi:MAG: cobalamin biosynthesis protein CobD, partial [Gemmatimonadetes bacterium]|nr:cobalamin biosynthesis protein CobD [Gemmatimonadota bacterium]